MPTVDEIGRKQIKSFNAAIEFKNVSFSFTMISAFETYKPYRQKGTTVALVGSSGSGKINITPPCSSFSRCDSRRELLIRWVNIKDYSLKK